MSSFSDSLLDDFVCSSCFKYLSVMPVRTYEDKSKKCGRCAKENDGGFDSEGIKLYETLKYPCVNRFEGCQVMLLPSDVVEHEKGCTSTSYQCPLCLDSEMPLYEMWQHFKSSHQKNLLEKPAVSIDLSIYSNHYFIYRRAGFIFMWNISVYARNVLLTNELIGPYEIAKNVKQQFKMSSSDDSVELVSNNWFKSESSFSKELFSNINSDILCEIILEDNIEILKKNAFNVGGPQSIFSRKLHLTDEFKQHYPLLKLSPCEFFLLEGPHEFSGVCNLCGDCGEFVFYYVNSGTVCRFCKTYMDERSNDKIFFHRIYYSPDDVLYYCKWNCEKSFNYFNIFKHELDCKKRSRIPYCPMKKCQSSTSFENFTELKEHFKKHRGKHISFKMEDIQKDFYYGFSNEFTVCFEVNQDNVTILDNSNFEQAKITPTAGLGRLYNHPCAFNRILDGSILRIIGFDSDSNHSSGSYISESPESPRDPNVDLDRDLSDSSEADSVIMLKSPSDVIIKIDSDSNDSTHQVPPKRIKLEQT